MSLIASAKAVSTTPPIEAGAYAAICYGMIDLGMQFSEQYGRSSHKIAILWEIPSEILEVNGEHVTRTISQTYTCSLSERAALRRDLESWRGRPFTDAELTAFDLRNIVGAPCMLNIIHTERNGNTYANVSTIMRLPKGMEAPKGTREHLIFDLDESDLALLEKMPKWAVDKIKSSETYAERIAGEADQSGDEDIDTETTAVEFQEELTQSDEELPF